MSLIPCPECGREISTNAEACPHCGNPMRPASHTPTGPRCYACSAAATTRCQRCNALSCAQHVKSIYVSHNKGGAYELRCDSCYSSAKFWNAVAAIVCIIVALFILVAIASHHH